MQYLLDTHTLLWRLTQPRKLSKRVRAIFSKSTHQFTVPTIALLETQYLIDIGRIDLAVDDVLTTIQEEPQFSLVPYDEVVMLHSLRLTGTRDPFDRIILAHALATSTQILTHDQWMKKMAPHLVIG